MGAQPACSCVCTAKFVSCSGRRFEKQQWRLLVLNDFTFPQWFCLETNDWSQFFALWLLLVLLCTKNWETSNLIFPPPYCWNRVCAFISIRAAGWREWGRIGKLSKGSFPLSWGKDRSVYRLWAGAMQPLGRIHWSNQFGLTEAKSLSAGLISLILW